VFVEEEYDAHGKHEEDRGRLAHLKRPRNVRQVVEDDVGQRRVPVHVGHAVVHDHHHERSQHEHKEHVDVRDEQLDEVRMQAARHVVAEGAWLPGDRRRRRTVAVARRQSVDVVVVTVSLASVSWTRQLP